MAVTRLRQALGREWWPALVVLVGYGALIALVLRANGGNPLAFAHLTERSDGLHYYHIALDPLGAWRTVNPFYYQRILYPALAALVALGQPGGVPWGLVGVNLAAITALTYLLSHILRRAGRSPWWALLVSFHLGMFIPLYYDLTEPLSLCLALAGLWLVARGRYDWGGGVLLLALLARETILFAVLALLGYWLLERRFSLVVRAGALMLGSYVLWQALVWGLTGHLGAEAGRLTYSWIPFDRALHDDLGAGAAAPWPFLIQLGIPAGLLLVAVLTGRGAWRGLAGLLVLAHIVLVAYLPWPTTTGFIHYDRSGLGLLLSALLLGAGPLALPGPPLTGTVPRLGRQVAYGAVALSTIGGWALLLARVQGP